jgi:hypothetical protein
MANLISDVKGLAIDGTKVLIRDGTATISFGGETRTAQFSGQEVIGPTVQAVAAEIGLTLSLEAGTDIDATFVKRNAEIRVILDTGDEWLMRAAFNTEPPAFAGGDGALTITYQGKKIIQTKKAS